MENPGRLCVWCGSAANSKEHVYPQWLRKFRGPASYIAKHGSYHHSEPQLVARTDDHGEFVEYEEVRGKLTPNLHEVQVKVVCRDCNSGWMSRLETDTEPLVHRLTQGAGPGISPDEARQLATWAHKTFLMYDLWQDPRDRCYPQSDYQSFHEHREPVGDVRLYVGASNSGFSNFGMWSDSRRIIPAGADPDTYIAEHLNSCSSSYFAVDGLIIVEHWFAADYPTSDPTARSLMRKSHQTARRLGLEQLWPDPQPPARWPRRVLKPKATEKARLSLFNAIRPLSVHAKRVPPPR